MARGGFAKRRAGVPLSQHHKKFNGFSGYLEYTEKIARAERAKERGTRRGLLRKASLARDYCSEGINNQERARKKSRKADEDDEGKPVAVAHFIPRRSLGQALSPRLPGSLAACHSAHKGAIHHLRAGRTCPRRPCAVLMPRIRPSVLVFRSRLSRTRPASSLSRGRSPSIARSAASTFISQLAFPFRRNASAECRGRCSTISLAAHNSCRGCQ